MLNLRFVVCNIRAHREHIQLDFCVFAQLRIRRGGFRKAKRHGDLRHCVEFRVSTSSTSVFHPVLTVVFTLANRLLRTYLSPQIVSLSCAQSETPYCHHATTTRPPFSMSFLARTALTSRTTTRHRSSERNARDARTRASQPGDKTIMIQSMMTRSMGAACALPRKVTTSKASKRAQVVVHASAGLDVVDRRTLLVGSVMASMMIQASPAKALDVGAKAPDFALPGTGGGATVELSNILQEHDFAVVYFFNQAGSPGCTIESQRF